MESRQSPNRVASRAALAVFISISGCSYFDSEPEKTSHKDSVESRRAVETTAAQPRLKPLADPKIAQIEREWQQQQKAAEEARAALHQKWADEAAAREREEKGPDVSDPAYFDKLAERMLSDNVLYRSQAIDALLKADRAAVRSWDTKKRIAWAFKALAEDKRSDEHSKAIAGLAKWAGKYSLPILLAMLDKEPAYDEEAVIRTLAELKDARAAPALAARLGHFRLGQIAFAGLSGMGSAAEEALLEVVPSEGPKACVAAITLLGDVASTDKCLDTLRRAEGSRHESVRLAAIAAVQKIDRRRLEASAVSKNY
jgi:hypothetical protein